MPLDRPGLERLYVENERALYNLVYRWVWNAADAQDLVQDTFVRLWQKRDAIREDSVVPLAYRIALNLAASRRRRLRLLQWLPFRSEHHDLQACADGGETLDRETGERRVRQAVDRLPGKLKQVLFLCEFSEFSYAEVGAILHIPAGTVGSRRNKALKLLARSLKTCDAFCEEA